MAKRENSRRDILKGGIAAGIAALGVGCAEQSVRGSRRVRAPQGVPAPRVVPEADLRAGLRNLVRALGPWRAGDDKVAADFLNRYLSDQRVEWLLKNPDDIQALMASLPKNVIVLEEIELSSYTKSQRELLEGLVDDLYGALELRCFIDGQPPPGVCLG
jgi:hypothetical protein